MTAVRLLAADAFRALVSRRTSLVLAILALALLTAMSCSLQITGQTVVNGRVSPVGDEARLSLAIGTAFAGIHCIGVLVVLFLVVPAIVGEIDSGLAAWVLVKPLSRRTYLVGRLVGGAAFLAAFSAVLALGLEILLLKYRGGVSPRLVLGWAVLVVLLAAYLAWGVLFAIHLGPGPGGILLLLLAGAGAFVDADGLTRTFLGVGAGEGPRGILEVFLVPAFGGGSPPLAARAAYGVAYVALPGTGNVHDLAMAAAGGGRLALPLDLLSAGIMLAGLPIAAALAVRALERREP